MILLSQPIDFIKVYIKDLKSWRLIPAPQKFLSLSGRTLSLDQWSFEWKHGITRTWGVEPKNGQMPFDYITKYIIKAYNPLHESYYQLMNQALQWVLRKRSFSHSRRNVFADYCDSLDLPVIDDIKPKRVKPFNCDVKILIDIHLNNGKLYQAIGFRRGDVFFPKIEEDVDLWTFELKLPEIWDFINYKLQIRYNLIVHRWKPVLLRQTEFARWVRSLSRRFPRSLD